RRDRGPALGAAHLRRDLRRAARPARHRRARGGPRRGGRSGELGGGPGLRPGSPPDRPQERPGRARPRDRVSAPAAAPWYASAAVLGVGRALDAAAPIVPEEAELAVEALNVDATSYKAIRERCDGDPARMADCIAAIVRERGKLQN